MQYAYVPKSCPNFVVIHIPIFFPLFYIYCNVRLYTGRVSSIYIVTKEKTVSRTQNLKYHVKRSDVPEIEPVYRQQITHHTLSILYQNRRKYKEHIGDNSYIRLLF